MRTLPLMPAHLYEAELEKSLQSEGAMVRWAITAVDEEAVTAEVVLLPHAPPPRDARSPRAAPTTMTLPDGLMRSSGAQLLACADHVVAAAAVLAGEESESGALRAGGSELGKAGRSCAAAADSLDEREWAAATQPLSDAARSLAAAAVSLHGHGCGAALAEAAVELEDASSVTGCISLAAARHGQNAPLAVSSVTARLPRARRAALGSSALSDGSLAHSAPDRPRPRLLELAATKAADVTASDRPLTIQAAAGPSVSACGVALSAASLALGAHAHAVGRNDGVGVTAEHREAGARLAEASGCLREAGAAMAESGANLEQGKRPL